MEYPVIYEKPALQLTDAYHYISQKYSIDPKDLALFAGASLLPFYPPHLYRPITDIDLLTPRNIPQLRSDLDFRSVPWGLVFVNPLLIEEHNGIQIDVLNKMIHLHIAPDSPLKGLIYRFPLEEAVEQAIEINGMRVVKPEFTILYKLLYWRNGIYNGWDRVKRDIQDIEQLFSYGIANYEELLKFIKIYAPDPKIYQVLLERLNIALHHTTSSAFPQPQETLAPTRQWGNPTFPDEVIHQIHQFIESNERYKWIILPPDLKIVVE